MRLRSSLYKYFLSICAPEGLNFLFTAMIELADSGSGPGTRYTATVIHADEAGCNQHRAMGFEAGWGAALDQLVAMVKKGEGF